MGTTHITSSAQQATPPHNKAQQSTRRLSELGPEPKACWELVTLHEYSPSAALYPDPDSPI